MLTLFVRTKHQLDYVHLLTVFPGTCQVGSSKHLGAIPSLAGLFALRVPVDIVVLYDYGWMFALTVVLPSDFETNQMPS